MNWNRIGRTVFCLLVVCCLIVNISPIKAEATMVTTSAIVSVAVQPIVISIIKGLGVTAAAAAGSTALAAIADSCIAHLQELGLCQEMTIDVFGYTLNGYSLFGITPAIINAVRDWLFDSETVAENIAFTTSGFSVSSISSSALTSVYYTCDEFQACLYDAYFTKNALILGVNGSYLTGFFWDDAGELLSGCWENPAGVTHVSVLGCVSLSELTLLNTMYVFDEYGVECPIYFNQEVAEQSEDYLFNDVRAIDWSTLFKPNTYYFDVNSYVKNAEDSVWSGTCKYSDIYLYNNVFQPYINKMNFPVSADVITWESSSATTFSVPEGLELEQIAPQEQSLQEGYSTWHGNSITVQDPSTKEEIAVMPIPQVYTSQEALGLTQQQIWEGTLSDAIVDANKGTLAGTDTGTFFESLADVLMTPFEWLLDGIKSIFVPSEDFLSAKVEALRTEFSFADSIIDTFEMFSGSFLDFDSSPPVIYIDLSAAETLYDWGPEVVFVDFSWYARYKPTVDVLLSAFLWLVFFWRVGIHLPNIIRGVAGDVPGGISSANTETHLIVRR